MVTDAVTVPAWGIGGGLWFVGFGVVCGAWLLGVASGYFLGVTDLRGVPRTVARLARRAVAGVGGKSKGGQDQEEAAWAELNDAGRVMLDDGRSLSDTEAVR